MTFDNSEASLFLSGRIIYTSLITSFLQKKKILGYLTGFVVFVFSTDLLIRDIEVKRRI